MGSKIEIEQGSISDDRGGAVFIDVFCGNYCFRLRHIRINNKAMIEWRGLANKLDWIADDRIKIFIFIMRVKGMEEVDAINAVFTKKCLKNDIYRNLYNAGGMNEEKKSRTKNRCGF